MKRYTLKKDLPIFKAGTEFRLTKKGHLAAGDKMVFHKNDLKAHPEILKDWFEEIQDKPKTIWDLKDGDMWYFINYNSMHCYVTSTRTLDCIKSFGEINNVFLTKEEAEKELARRKAKQILLRDTKGFKPDWEQFGMDKYTVYYNAEAEQLKVSCWGYYNYGTISFATREDADASIKNHRQEWLTYLGVYSIIK